MWFIDRFIQLFSVIYYYDCVDYVMLLHVRKEIFLHGRTIKNELNQIELLHGCDDDHLKSNKK